MIHKSNNKTWPTVDLTTYKNDPGTWQDVSRRVLFSSPNSLFETRYFELAPEGYSSHEHHQHEHCVVVLQGEGEVLLDNDWHTISEGDVIHVSPHQPHQFRNPSSEPFGILCIVNRERDVPQLLGNLPESDTSIPRTSKK